MVASALSNAGITNFLPLVTETHRWSDRRKSVDVPLFPGYVFVQIPNSAETQLRVRQRVAWCSLSETSRAQCLSKIRKLTTSRRYWSRERALSVPFLKWDSG